MDKHKKLFKGKSDVSDIRNQRSTQTIELRQNRRDDIIKQKRMMKPSDDDNTLSTEAYVRSLHLLETHKEQELIMAALSENREERIIALKTIRTVLSNREHRPVDVMIEANVLPVLYKCIERFNEPDEQYEALWSLTNIASGETHQTYAVVKNNFIPLLKQVLQSKIDKVAEQAAWALANIIGEGPELRNQVLESDVLSTIHSICCQSDRSIYLKQNIAWMMINVVRSKEQPIEEPSTSQSLAILSELLASSDDIKVLSDICWAIGFLADSNLTNATCVIESDIMAKTLRFLGKTNDRLQLGIIRSLGNLAAGPDDHTEYVCRLNVVQRVSLLLDSGDNKLVQETLWLLSNIAAGTRDQMRILLIPEVIDRVMIILQEGLHMHQKEAIWVVSNIIHNGESFDSLRLIEAGIIESMTGLLRSKDSIMLRHALDSFNGLLKVCSSQSHIILEKFEICGGVEAVEHLTNHPNKDIVELANILSSKLIRSDMNSYNAIIDDSNLQMDLMEDDNHRFNGYGF